MARDDPLAPIARFEIGSLSRSAAEALALELRRLAKRHAIDIKELCFQPATAANDGTSERG